MPGTGSEEPAAWLDSRILIIEDEVMIAWMIETLLLDAGYSDIVIASDVERAKVLALELAPNLIISDINLGGNVDGIDVSLAIQRNQDIIPVIFVSAYADADARQRIADGLPHAQLLRKPIEDRVLTEAVHRALTRNFRN